MRSLRPGVAIIVALVLVSVGAALTASGSAAPATTVATGPSGLGRIIVDGRGRTLYLFEKDRRGASG
jgi:predicted lipoprotein with Yx(FWY)xxD motif